MVKKDFLGVVLYDGPSLIDGNPIVAIANGFKRNRNKKVGKMVKIWIIRKDISPNDACNEGKDKSVCGTCKHRNFRSCYVNISHGPQQIFDAFKRGRYELYDSSMISIFEGLKIRIGAYGDPAAIPYEILEEILSVSAGFTGYTHRWKSGDSRYKNIIMASVETIEEYLEAKKRGWRTFRVRLENEPILENEFICPASKEGGKKTSCSKCNLCNGLSTAFTKTPVIIVHGIEWKLKRYLLGLKQFKSKKKYARVFKKIG